MVKTSLLILVVFIFGGCASPRLMLNHENLPDELAIKLYIPSIIDSTTSTMLDSITYNFVHDYNERGHSFELYFDNEAEEQFLEIEINDIHFVESNEQAISTVISIIGVATFVYTISDPNLGFYVGWYWIPNYSLTSTFYLSNDIRLNPEPIVKYAGQFHAYRSIESQRRELGHLYYKLLVEAFSELENP